MKEERRLISLEHAKTRGLVNLALSNTQALHHWLNRVAWVVVAMSVVLAALVLAVVWLWFR